MESRHSADDVSTDYVNSVAHDNNKAQDTLLKT